MENSEKNKTKHRKVKLVNILLFLIFIGALVLAYHRINLKRKLTSKIEAIQATGMPITLDDMNFWYSMPPLEEENAAYIIMEAGSYYNEPNDQRILPIIGNEELPGRTESMREGQKDIISQFLDKNQKCIELLHTTAGLEYSRYPMDFTVGMSLKTPHLSYMKYYAELLALESVIACENGNSEEAFESIRSIFGVANSLDKEPLIISQLVRMSCQSLAISNIEYVLNRMTFSDEQLKSLDALLGKAEKSQGMSGAMFGERAAELDMILHTQSFLFDPSNNPVLSLPPVLFLYKLLGLNERDALVFLDYLDEVNKVLSLPPKERVEGIKVLDIKTDEIRRRSQILKLIIPSLGRIVANEIRHIANIRVARSGLAVERYRLKHNKLPESLDALVPDYLASTPLDVFDGKEIRYKQLDKGFVVYSIGSDMTDEGGKEQVKDKKRKEDSTYDMTFIIER